MKQKTITVTFQLRVPTWMPVAMASTFIREAIAAAAPAFLAKRALKVETIDGEPVIAIYRNRVEVFAP